MTDFLIVGQGLAGTTIAHYLIDKGISFHIIDNPEYLNSTKVAAGLINPITGRRYVKSWMVDTFIPLSKSFYESVEHKIKDKIHHEMSICKILANEEIQGFFHKKMQEDSMKSWKDNQAFSKPAYVNYPLESIGAIKGARLDTKKYLSLSHQLFLDKNHYIEGSLDYKELKLGINSSKYDGKEYKFIIFCEGYKMKDNPYFNFLPLNLCKGEVLTLKTDHQLNGCYQKNNFIMPIDEQSVKVGSNYEWEDLTEIPTEKTKEALLEKMNQVVSFDFEIENHQAGIRPTVKDRRPFLGNHPEHKNLFVFNGLGTKGVSLAPFMANHLLEHILENKELMKEVDIKRFN